MFALLGLLIAFTFSGAYERFEAREMRIIDEVNSIETAYARIDLLAPQTQATVRQDFRDYINSRINVYKKLPDFKAAEAEVARSVALKNKLWTDVIEACRITNTQAATMLLVPAINNLSEIANTRFAIRFIHPPVAVFILLVGLATLSSFLAGYSTVGKGKYNFIYILSYAAITALTIYMIIDLEMPRLGLIRVDKFDSMIVEIRNQLN